MKAQTTNPLSNSIDLSALKITIFKPVHYFGNWIKTQEPIWENNRLGIAAIGIFIQVSFAAVMIAILGLAGASPFVFTIGIFFAFFADSLAFAQAPMRLVIGMMCVSILVNLSLTIYYGYQLIN